MTDGIDDDWAEVMRIFPRPWKIHDVPDGSVWIEDATGKPIVHIYHRRNDVADWKKASHEEALVLAKAIARMRVDGITAKLRGFGQ